MSLWCKECRRLFVPHRACVATEMTTACDPDLDVTATRFDPEADTRPDINAAPESAEKATP